MKVTKIHHSCILVEDRRAKILIDPGTWMFQEGVAKTSDFNDIDAVLVTHNHMDHFYLDFLKEMKCRIITNSQIQNQLKEMGVSSEILRPGETVEINGIKIEAVDCPHGILPVPGPENIGFLINDRVFHPGDCVSARGVNTEILLLPVIAPWMRMVEAVEFANALKPRVVVPIHDGFLKYPVAMQALEKVLKENGIDVKAWKPWEYVEI